MKILIIRFSALGDLVTLEPLFRALRHFHQGDHITFLTSPVGKELYEDTGYFDRIVIEQGGSRGDILRRVGRLRRELGKERFGLVYNLQSSTFSHLLTLMLPKKKSINISASFLQKLLSIKIRVRHPSNLLLAAGFPERAVADYFELPHNKKIMLSADPRLVQKYSDLLSRSGSGPRTVALAPGASARWESKKWGDGRFAELAAKLQDAGWQVVVVGSELERDAARLIAQYANRTLDCTGQTSVGQLKALLHNIDVFIGNDSGPAHIAAAVGTATISIFAPTSQIHCVQRLPYRGSHICLAPEGDICTTCYKPNCPSSRACMASIGVERVFNAAVELVQAGPSYD